MSVTLGKGLIGRLLAAGGFSIAGLDMTGHWHAPFAGSPWPAIASAGSSGSNGDLVEAFNPPSTGTALNGLVPVSFDGVNDKLTCFTAITTFVTEEAGWIACLFKADTAVADAGASLYYTNPCLVTDTSIECIALSFSDGGIRLGCYNGADYDGVSVSCGTGEWHFAQARWNDTTIEVRVDRGDWETLARTVVLSGSTLRVGANYNVSACFDGLVAEVMCGQFRISDDDSDSLVSEIEALYDLDLSTAPFDVASLSATMYTIDYSGAPWVGTASAGTSGSHNFVTGGADPVVGTSYGSHSSASFDGTQFVNSADTLGDLITVSAFTLDFIVKFNTAGNPAGSGSEYVDPAIFADLTGGELFVTYTTAGISAGQYSSPAGYSITTPIALAPGSKASVQVKYDGTDLKCRVNGGAWESTPVGNMQSSAMASSAILGASYAAASKIDGEIARAMAFQTALSDDVLNDLYADMLANY